MSTDFTVESDINFDVEITAPNFDYEPSSGETVVVIATPGQKGDKGDPGTPGTGAASNFRHDQVNPDASWVIHHTLGRPIAACQVVSAGEQVLANWIEDPVGTVTIFFAGICSGYAILS